MLKKNEGYIVKQFFLPRFFRLDEIRQRYQLNSRNYPSTIYSDMAMALIL